MAARVAERRPDCKSTHLGLKIRTDRRPLIDAFARFFFRKSWLLTFGEPCLTFVEPTATGDFRERRVAFRDSRDIDFSLVPVAAIQQMIGQQIPVEIADVFWRGFRILVDKDRLAEQLTDSARRPEKADKLPTESMWRETGQDFLYQVLLSAKKAYGASCGSLRHRAMGSS